MPSAGPRNSGFLFADALASTLTNSSFQEKAHFISHFSGPSSPWTEVRQNRKAGTMDRTPAHSLFGLLAHFITQPTTS